MSNEMNRYQIILESEKVFSDDDFQRIIEDDLCIHTGSGMMKSFTAEFKLVSAINLEGIRQEEIIKLAKKIIENDKGDITYFEDTERLAKLILSK